MAKVFEEVKPKVTSGDRNLRKNVWVIFKAFQEIAKNFRRIEKLGFWKSYIRMHKKIWDMVLDILKNMEF